MQPSRSQPPAPEKTAVRVAQQEEKKALTEASKLDNTSMIINPYDFFLREKQTIRIPTAVKTVVKANCIAGNQGERLEKSIVQGLPDTENDMVVLPEDKPRLN